MEASGINMRRYPSYSSGETCCGGDDSEYGLPSYVPAPVPFPFSPISTKRRSLGARGLLRCGSGGPARDHPAHFGPVCSQNLLPPARRCSWLPWVLWFVVVGGLLVFLALYGSPISIQIHIHQAAAVRLHY